MEVAREVSPLILTGITPLLINPLNYSYAVIWANSAGSLLEDMEILSVSGNEQSNQET
jgi:hypothetical protein